MDSTFFRGNRHSLLRSLGGDSLIVMTAHTEMQRSNDTSYPFEQEANFRYLCGIAAPDWWLIIDGKRGRSYAVSPTISDSKQIFDGSLSAEMAATISGVDEVVSKDKAIALLKGLSLEFDKVYSVNDSKRLKQNVTAALNPAQGDLQRKLKRYFSEVLSCRSEIVKLRALKQPSEIEAMQKAIDITGDGFRAVLADLGGYSYEYQAEARLGYEFRSAGADGHAYTPIVANAGQACTLHYVENNAKLVPGTLLLIDAAAQYKGYCADITRTYAIGDVSQRAKVVHGVVQQVQTEIIALCEPGLGLEDLQRKSDQLMGSALESLGLLNDARSLRKYFPHSIGHGLGLDVHDSLGGYEALVPGMVITIEPGIYIPEENIGVRIEDDILVTKGGARNLSAKLSTDL